MTQAVTYVSVPLEEWERIRAILERVEARLVESEENRDGEWIGTDEACKMLGVTPRTWQNYRKRFKISVSQVGRSIRVLRADVEKLIKQSAL